MSTPTTRLVVVEHNPARRLRLGLTIGALWLGSLVSCYFFVRESIAPGFAQLSQELSRSRNALVEAQREAERLQRLLARHERGQQVAERANQDLQDSLRAQQEEVASLRNDLGFYQRLMEGGAQQAGIAVHSLTARATDQAGAVQYGLILSQNLKRNRQATGRVEISIGGSSQGRSIRLGAAELGAEPGGSAFAFKYFQQIDGLWMFPDGFTPATVKVRVLPEGGGNIEREFPWNEIYKKDNG